MRPSTSAARYVPPAKRSTCAARLPFDVELGPYRLAVELRSNSQMSDRRRLACVNIEDERIELRYDVQGLRQAEVFLEAIIRLSHFSNGCQQGCVEEAYAHSFAAGMVEFAQRNPRAWLWLNLLLSKHLRGNVQYDRAVRGVLPRAPAMPQRILVAGKPVTIRRISKAETGNAFGWYDFDRREVQLYAGLSGSNLSIVALHEITHAVHHVYALRDHDRHHSFKHSQLEGWLSIMKDSPGAWRWLAWVMSFPPKASALQR